MPLKNPPPQALRRLYHFHRVRERYRINGASYLLVICLDPGVSTVGDRIIRHLSFVWCGFPGTIFDLVFVVLDSHLCHIRFGLGQSHEALERWFRRLELKSSNQRVCISPDRVVLRQ
jgi:hypothetical protein